MDYGKRTAAFRVLLERMGLDAYWLLGAANVRYLSGFTGQDSGLLITASRSVLVTDSRYVEQAEEQAQVDEVVSRHTPMAQAACTLCKALRVGRLGVTGANLTHADYVALSEGADGVRIKSCASGIAEKLRMRKDAEEVEAVRAALRLAEASFRSVLERVEPGRSERWLAARLEYEMRSAGADGASFESICAVDGNASIPHAISGESEVTPQSSILFDWGARLEGYCSDLTRIFCVGRIASDLRGLVDVAMDAQAAVLEKLKPGSRCCDADAAGRALIAKAGYGKYFGHGVGHGVGLVVHEGPRLGPGVETVLLPGMIVTVEPGVYLPGKVGVRIEDMALITPQGCEVLSSLPRKPEEFTHA